MRIKKTLLLLAALYAGKCISQNTPASPLDRVITLQAVNEPVSSLLEKIEKLAQLNFSYNSGILDGTKRLSVSFTNKSVKEVIRLMFQDKIKCKIKENHVILMSNNKTEDEKKAGNKLSDSGDKKTIIVIRDTILIRDTIIQFIHDTVYETYAGDSARRDSMKNTAAVGKYEAGLMAGLNLAGAAGVDNSSITAGFHAGGYLHIRINRKLAFRPELVFSVKGYSYSAVDTFPPYLISTSAVQRYFYLDIPLQLKINISERFHVLAGPYLGILTQASYGSSTFVDDVLNHRDNGTNMQEHKRTDLGGTLGAGYQLSRRINCGLKYSRGLTGFSKSLSGATNSVFSAYVGYKIK